MAGLFNRNDQFDFKLNVNGKEVTGEEAVAHAQNLINKLSDEMGGLVKKLGKNVTSNITSNSLEAIKEKVLPENVDLNAIKDKIIPEKINIDSLKDLLNQETLGKLQEKLPVIDASNDDGLFKVNVNGKPLLTFDVSEFLKK